MQSPTERFSTRVENYVRYRPGYPTEVLRLLQSECGLTSESAVADIGSGTGKLTELLLQSGARVVGVEPNQPMRDAGEQLLSSSMRFTSVAASAEATGLEDGSVDLIVAGQAFHWFDHERCRAEFVRILNPGGWVALVWNDRQADTTPFLAGYEALLREFATDYQQVNHRNIDADALKEFFRTEPQSKRFSYVQNFDFDGLKGRLLSSSYAPERGQPKHDAMLACLRKLFDSYQADNQVAFRYDTLVYYGRLR